MFEITAKEISLVVVVLKTISLIFSYPSKKDILVSLL